MTLIFLYEYNCFEEDYEGFVIIPDTNQGYLKTYIELGENKREELVKTIQADLLHEITHINNIFLFESNHEHILPSVFCHLLFDRQSQCSIYAFDAYKAVLTVLK